jgi:tetratricopeptide (TPR) repeat protein
MGSRAASVLAGTLVLLAFPAVAPAQPEPPERGAGPGDTVHEQEQRVLDDVNEPRGLTWAEGVPLDRRKRAYEHFRAGNLLFSREADFPEAADRYRAALELWDHPAFHYNLGITQMQLGQQIDAYEHFLAARKHGAHPITEQKYQQAKEWLDRLRAQLGELEVICNEPGAEVVVDGKSLFTGPGRQRVMVLPGSHRVQASKPRFVPDIQPIVIDPGDSKRVTVTPRIPEHLITVRRWPRWMPWAVAGAGAVALAGASVMDWHSTRLFDRFDHGFHEICSGSPACRDAELPAALQEDLHDGRTWQWAARATYLAGSVTVATSAALLYLNRERIARQKDSMEPDHVSLAPMLMQHGAGVSAMLSF